MQHAAFDRHEIEAVIERVRHRMGDGGAPPPKPEPVSSKPGHGIYANVDDAVGAARQAFETTRGMGLKMRHRLIDAVRATMRGRAREMAEMAHRETGLGRAEDKVLKNRQVIEKTPGPEDLEPHVWSGDQGLTITEFAPFGVIGAITPTTNPTATIINNTIAAVSAGNAVVFNAHPNAKRVSVEAVRLLNRAIVSAGGPTNLVTAVPEPTIELSLIHI